VPCSITKGEESKSPERGALKQAAAHEGLATRMLREDKQGTEERETGELRRKKTRDIIPGGGIYLDEEWVVAEATKR